MRIRVLLVTIALCLGSLTGCKNQSDPNEATEGGGSDPVENIDAAERAEAAKLQAVRDPIEDTIYEYRLKVRQAYNNRAFGELEKMVAEVRSNKALFQNGSWKIVQFYEALDSVDGEAESVWQEHDRDHQEWIAAEPVSTAARVGDANVPTGRAWEAW